MMQLPILLGMCSNAFVHSADTIQLVRLAVSPALFACDKATRDQDMLTRSCVFFASNDLQETIRSISF